MVEVEGDKVVQNPNKDEDEDVACTCSCMTLRTVSDFMEMRQTDRRMGRSDLQVHWFFSCFTAFFRLFQDSSALQPPSSSWPILPMTSRQGTRAITDSIQSSSRFRPTLLAEAWWTRGSSGTQWRYPTGNFILTLGPNAALINFYLLAPPGF